MSDYEWIGKLKGFNTVIFIDVTSDKDKQIFTGFLRNIKGARCITIELHHNVVRLSKKSDHIGKIHLGTGFGTCINLNLYLSIYPANRVRMVTVDEFINMQTEKGVK